MKAYDQARSMSGTIPVFRASESPSGWTWWIGKGFVTGAEIESWQLGPDLTETLEDEERFAHV